MKSVHPLTLVFIFGLPMLAECMRKHPIAGVLKMLEARKAETSARGQEEEANYNKFAQWCLESMATLEKTVADGKSAVQILSEEASAKTKQIETLQVQTTALMEQLQSMQSRKTRAESTRADEADLYKQAQKDIDGTIDAIGVALARMQKANKTDGGFIQQDLNQSMGFLKSILDDKQLTVLNKGLASPNDSKVAVKKYSFKGGSVIELLKQLEKKFKVDKADSTAAETNAINAHVLAGQARDTAIAEAEESKKQKMLLLGEVQGRLAEIQGDLKNTKEDLQADSGALGSTGTQCSMKKMEWTKRSNTRTEEIEAMAVAIGILSKVTDVRTDKPSNPKPPTVLLQVGMEEKRVSRGSHDHHVPAGLLTQVVQMLRMEAQVAHSHSLEWLAFQIKPKGTFDEVIPLLQKMVFRLQDEQRDEAEHKAWCDQELEKTDILLRSKKAKSEELQTSLDSKKAKTQLLMEEIAKATKMMNRITATIAEATAIREAGKEENSLALKDAQNAQKAVANAVAVLESFYKKSGAIKKEAWEFFQAPVDLPRDPATWTADYTGVADPKKQPGGIIAVLEKIAEDFAKMEADTKAQEATDQSEFTQFLKDSEIEKARRTKEIELKTEQKGRLVESVADLTSRIKRFSKEIQVTQKHEDDLKPACVVADSTFAERAKARAGEIEALRKAQALLTAEDTNVLQSFAAAPPARIAARSRVPALRLLHP